MALPSGELATALRHHGRQTFSTALCQAAAQNCHEFGLILRIESFSGIESLVKSDLLTHQKLLTYNNSFKPIWYSLLGQVASVGREHLMENSHAPPTSNLELGTWNLELGTWNLELGT
ncbi:MAG: hypothetical protein WD872_13105, partial [Pirellulaceae bacterium]